MKVDVEFPIVSGGIIHKDHGYDLFGAISRIAPFVHKDPEVHLHRIPGKAVFKTHLKVLKSHVALRLPTERVGELKPLEGAVLDLSGLKLALGSPRIVPLRSYRKLYSSNVVFKFKNRPINPDTFKMDLEPARQMFGEILDRKLAERGIKAERIIGHHPHPITILGRSTLGWPTLKHQLLIVRGCDGFLASLWCETPIPTRRAKINLAGSSFLEPAKGDRAGFALMHVGPAQGRVHQVLPPERHIPFIYTGAGTAVKKNRPAPTIFWASHFRGRPV